ncbi:MAG: general secretion pathway protein GspK [Armatimonadetes bacterium]|nr:general secretion pathway protein GspK [Armatimonadota bacterium]
MRKQRGSAFIMSLALTLVMILVVTSFGMRIGSHIRTEATRNDQRAAFSMAESGIAQARLNIELLTTPYTTTTDDWVALGQNGDENFLVGNGSFRIQILDAGAFVNLNSVSEEQLQRMNIQDELISALLDWREEQLQPRALGAKDEFYNTLTTPYNAKLRNFDSVDELLLVKGFTPALLYQVQEDVSGELLVPGDVAEQPALYELLTTDSASLNQREDGTARVNVNTVGLGQLIQAGLQAQTAQAIIQRRNTQGTFEGIGEVFATQNLQQQDLSAILSNLTTTAEPTVKGKINLNTASEAVLNSIPEMTTDITEAILSRQGSFVSLGELAEIPGVTAQVLQDIADYFTVGSSAFIARIQGKYNNATVTIEAVITLNEENRSQVLKIRRLPASVTVDQWGWADESTTDTTLMEAQ